MAKVKRIKDNAAEIERVAAENRQLKAKLATVSQNTVSKAEFEKLAAEKKVLTAKLAESASPDEIAEKDKAIASLQSSLQTANDELLESEARASKGDAQLDLLRKQLDETSGQLAQLELNPER